MIDEGQEKVRPEITASAVSPVHQGQGLGACVLSDIEWLVNTFATARGPLQPETLD
jgi:hypothetical protein